MPFSKDLAPSMLATTAAHSEAVARISWCVTEDSLGVITGEVGAGKTVAARAALATLDASRHTIIYIGNPAVAPIGQAVWAAPTVFAALMTNGAYLNGLFQPGDRFRWQISYMI